MTLLTNPSELYLIGEISLKNVINQLTVVRFVSKPLDDKKNIMNIKLTIFTLDSSSTIIPKKYPCPQKIKLDRFPKATSHQKLWAEVLMSISQNKTQIRIIGYRI